jgi:hypothetical protein
MKTLDDLRPIAGMVRSCDALAVPRASYYRWRRLPSAVATSERHEPLHRPALPSEILIAPIPETDAVAADPARSMGGLQIRACRVRGGDLTPPVRRTLFF